jgi:hypothetical protein
MSTWSPRWIFLSSALIVIAGTISLYAWISGQSPVYGDFTLDYTERLASGHEDLSLRPDPRLLTAANPYDPQGHPGVPAVLDASYFKGRYYVYFGPTAFVTLLVPWFLLTGRHLGEPAAVCLYACGGFLLAAAAILSARRRYFPNGGRFAAVLAILLVGLASPAELVTRRPGIYELVIICAWFHLALALVCAFQAVHSGKRSGPWLAAASISLGLAVGSRATYALGAALFLIWAWAFTTRRLSRVFSRRQWLLCAFLPLALIGGALAAFNWSRFGNPLEFGFSYQINELDRSKVAFWGLGNFGFNLEQYLFRPWRLGTYFPFFLGERAGPISTLKNYGRTEFLYGFLATVPLLALLVAAPWVLRRTPRLAMLALLAAGVSLLNLFALLGLINGSYRYQVDVVPGLLLVLGWTLLVLFEGSVLAGKVRVLALTGTALLVAFSCAVTFFAQFALLDVFEGAHPHGFERLSRIFNRPVFWAQSLLGYRPTVPFVTLQLPGDKYGHVEPLLVVGENALQDFLYLYYTGPGLLQIGYESIGRGGPVSAPVAVDYAVPHTVQIFYGSLVPPEGQPLLEGLRPSEAAALRRTLVVTLDGRPILDGWADFHRTKGLFFWGESPDDPAFGRYFTGKIISRSRAPLVTDPSPERSRGLSFGTMRLAADFSALAVGSRAPLVSAGYRNQGDLVFLERMSKDSVRAGVIVDGAAPETGPTLQLDPSRPHAVEVILGSLLPLTGSPAWPEEVALARQEELKRKVLVTVDGRVALRVNEETPDAAPSTVVAGSNAIGVAGVDSAFGSGLVEQDRDLLRLTIDKLNRSPDP